MPVINGRYYMNPQYGAALERDRAAGEESVRLNGAPKPTWLDRFLGFAPPEDRKDSLNRIHSDSDNMTVAASNSGRTAAAQKNRPEARASKPVADNTTVGNSVYNETSGLRPTSASGAGSEKSLSDARVGLAGVTKNLDATGTPVGKKTAPGRLTKSEERAVGTYPPAKQAYEDSQAAAKQAIGDRNGPKHFYLDHGQPKPTWAEGKEPRESHGPFRNKAGSGDVPKGADVWIRIYN